MSVRLVLQAVSALALTVLAVVVFARLPAMFAPLARTDYVKLPHAPAGANGGAYPGGTSQVTVVLVLLEGADERDLRALPALRRVWLESRYVPHAAPDANVRSVLATLLCGMDLGPYLFHPVAQVFERTDLRRMLGDRDALVARLAAGGTPVRVFGYRLLQELLGASVTKPGSMSAEFADAEPARSAARLTLVSRGTSGPAEGFHLVEIALPPRSSGMDRGSVLDRIDDALDRLRASMQPRQLLVVAGTEAADGLSPEVPVLFIGNGVVAGERDPRPLQDLVATLCLALGAPRPTRALGVPDVDLWQRDDRRAVPVLQAVVRDRAVVAAGVARELYGADLAMPVKQLEHAAATFLKGDGAGARRELEELLAAQDASLEQLRRSSRAAAAAPAAAPIAPRLMAGLGILALLVGFGAAPSATALVLGLGWLGMLLLIGARMELAPLTLDPYALGPADATRVFGQTALALVPVALGWTLLAALSRDAPATTMLSLWNAGGGLAALRLAWFLAYNGFTPGPASPGTLALRSAVMAGAALVAGPLVLWPAFAVLVPLQRRRAA